MSEGRVLAWNGALYILGTVVARGSPFALMIVYANILSAEQYGLVGGLVATVSLVAVFVGLRPDIYVIRNYHQKQGTFEDRVGSLCFLVLVTFLVVLSVMLIAAPLLPMPLNSAVIFAVAVTCLAGARAAHQLPDSILVSSGRPLHFVVSQIVLAAGLAVLCLPLVYVFRTWQVVALSTVVATIVAAVVSGWLVLRGGGWRGGARLFRPNRRYAGDAFAFLFPLSFHVIGFTSVQSIDRLILMEFEGPEVVGAYTAAYTLAMIIGVSHDALLKAWNPYFFRKVGVDGIKLRRMIGPQSLYALASIVTAVVYGIIAQWVFYAIFPGMYAYAAAIVPVTCLAYGVEGARKVFCGPLYVYSRTKTLAVISVGAAIINIVLNIMWIPDHGIVGAAYATLMAFLFMTVLVVLMSLYLSWNADRVPEGHIT